MKAYRVGVQRNGGNIWVIEIIGPLKPLYKGPERIVKTDYPEKEYFKERWDGQVHAPSLKMALVRLQHLIPELQED
jgi:hypothetical protein